MSLNWTLALVAAVIWGGAYGWYLIGSARLRQMWDRVIKRFRPPS